jgi:hypothetical protein
MRPHGSSNLILGSFSPCTNCFHVFFSSSVLSREMEMDYNWGKRGMIKWAEFLFSRASLWNGTPNPSFIGQKEIVIVGVTGYGWSNG